MTFWPRISYVMSTHSGSGGLFPMRSRGRNDSANSSYAQCTKVSAVNFFWQEPCRQQVDVNFYLAHALFHIRVFTISSAPRSTLFHVPFMCEPCAPRQCGPQVAGLQCWKIWSATTILRCRHLREFLFNRVLRLEGPLTCIT